MSYLGFVIDSEGLHKDRAKEQAIVAMPNPTNVTQVKAFCGLVNYYARFFPNLASVLKPLYDLTSKNTTKIVWNDRCEAAMNQVKNVITSDIVLAHYDQDLPVMILRNMVLVLV